MNDHQPPNRSPAAALAARFFVPALVVGLLMAFFVIIATNRPDRPAETLELGVLANPGEVYDPVRAGEPLPAGFRQVLPRDGIVPVYDPIFVAAAAVSWDSDTLVIGVEIDGEAKAYPIDFLNRREMVVDRLSGIPLLVTW